MATKKMTFTLPEELVTMFLRSVSSSRRSKYVADAIGAKLKEREEILRAACLAANDDPETRQIQSEFDALPEMMSEVWDDSSSR